jgi:hypothetical protein
MRFNPKARDIDLPDLPLSDIARGEQKAKKYRDDKAEGGRNALLSGASLGLFDNAAALIDSFESGDYELELLRRKRNQEQFSDLNPTASLIMELLGSVPSGTATFSGIKSVLTAGSKIGKTSDLIAGQGKAIYKTKKGKLLDVEIKGTSPSGNVIVSDGVKEFAVTRKALTARTSIKGDTPSNALVGSIEGAAWGFASGEDGDRAQSAVIGGMLGLSLGTALDVFTRPGSAGNLVGNRTPVDNVIDKDLIDLSEDFVAKSREVNDQSLRGVQSLEEADRALMGPTRPRQSYLDPYENAVGSNLYSQKEGIWRSVREGYDKWLTGTSDYLMRRISPQIGALAQRADETAIRKIGNDVVEYVDPITDVLKLELDDRQFKGMLLDYAKGSATKTDLFRYVSTRLGKEQAQALIRHLQWSDRKNFEHIKRVTGRSYQFKSYLHTQRIKKKRNDTTEPDFDYPTDPGLEKRSRADFKNNGVEPDDYQPILATNLRRIMNNERLVQLADKFGMPRSAGMKEPAEFFRAMQKHFVSKGIDPDIAKRGVEAIRENLIGQTRSPNQWLQALNSFGYATTLAGPKSALLNLQDPMVGSVKYGLGNVLKGMTQPNYSVTERGIRQNVGEFLNAYNDAFADQRTVGKRVADVMRNTTDWLMKGSGFAAADSIGKGWTIKGILNHANEAASRPGGLEDAWGFYFTKAELGQIKRQLKEHGTNFDRYSGKGGELLEELAFAGLGQQQLISGMGRPVGWARHPNARPLWALRGFAIKQQALLMREIVDNIRVGKMDEALKYFTRYVALAGGSFGLLNEARQWMFGDGEATIEGVVQGTADQVVSALTLNTIGLNDYQYGSLMQNGLFYTMAQGSVPIAADRPYEVVKGIYDSVQAPQGQTLAPLIKQVPFINQPLNLIQNLGEDNLIPQPLENLERQIRPGEQR